VAANEASRTAVLVCQGRAVAHGRLAVGRFDDPTAFQFLRVDERTPVERARAPGRPKQFSDRVDVELLGRQAEAMAVRTVAVDQVVRSAANPQLVVGAGLDGRAWRMPELAGVDVFELDHPASQRDKRRRSAARRPIARSLRFVPVDLAEGDAGPALGAAGHDPLSPTTWILEGILPYLTEEAAAATLQTIAGRSAPGSRMVITYQTGSARGGAGRLLARAAFVLVGRGDPMANEPWRSSWSAGSIAELTAATGLHLVDDIALAGLAADLDVPDRNVGTSRVAVAAPA
jgi:methyltransferase (TIGR00027 family)